jgi:hypothetical protein
MHPDYRAGRALQARLAASLAEPFGMFLAALEAPRQHVRRRRRSGGRDQLVEAQSQRQTP